jgi:hypothetical protein
MTTPVTPGTCNIKDTSNSRGLTANAVTQAITGTPAITGTLAIAEMLMLLLAKVQQTAGMPTTEETPAISQKKKKAKTSATALA